MAAASQGELLGGDAGAADEEKLKRERADAEAQARQFSDQELREKIQRTQDTLAGEIATRLPDGGRKLRLLLDAMHQQLSLRQARRGGERGPGGDGCERIIRSRCAESSDTVKPSHRHHMDQVGRKPGSGLPNDPKRAKLSKADFQLSFGLDEKADIGISSLEITTRVRNEPNTSVENEVKLCKEEDSSKPSSQPTNLFHEEVHVDTTTSMERISSDDKINGHNRMCEAAPTPSRKRKNQARTSFASTTRFGEGKGRRGSDR